MDKKDYKAIAEIMKRNLEKAYNMHGCMFRDHIRELADYFEKEQIEDFAKNRIMQIPRFNREQFLKDCGVV